MCYKLGEASRNEKEKGSFSPERERTLREWEDGEKMRLSW